MTAENIKNIILQGEGIDIEFKTSNSQLPSNIYDTICAFLNRNGGHIILGVDDNGTILGIDKGSMKDQLNNLAKGLNNSQILNPTTYLSPQVVDIDDKKVVWIYVPEGSQAYNYKGAYWDRNEDGDFKLSNKQLIANLYARKQTNYTENQVFKYLRLEDMEEELFDFVRKVVGLKDKNHIWVNMTNDELIPNFLIHREFSSAFPATLTIHKSTVVTENWNRPYNWGIITPDNFKPHPKNPTIANFFRQLGWVEELGYGVRNMFKYCPLYVEGALPIIEEKDIFKFIIQYESDGTASGTVKNRIKLFIAQHEGVNSNQILENFPELTIRTLRRILKEFKVGNKIEFRGAPKTGGYFLIYPKE